MSIWRQSQTTKFLLTWMLQVSGRVLTIRQSSLNNRGGSTEHQFLRVLFAEEVRVANMVRYVISAIWDMNKNAFGMHLLKHTHILSLFHTNTPLCLVSISPTFYERNCANFLAPVKSLTFTSHTKKLWVKL